MKRVALLLALLPSIAFAQQPAMVSIDYYNEKIGQIMLEASQIRMERDQLRQRVDMLTKQLADEKATEPKKEPSP